MRQNKLAILKKRKMKALAREEKISSKPFIERESTIRNANILLNAFAPNQMETVESTVEEAAPSAIHDCEVSSNQ